MKINILMSTYNGEKFLSEQIESIQKQTVRDWHLLIRDDGSSDGTREIIEDFAKTDSRITFINPDQFENFGVIKNFYTLLKHEQADYYFFSDQDDVWVANKLELTLKEAKKYCNTKPLMVYTDLRIVNQDLETIHDSMIAFQSHHANTTLKSELTENTVTGGTAMINHPLAELWTDYKDLLMHDWFLALLATAKGDLVYIDTVTELYRQHEDNVLGARTWSKRLSNWLSPKKSLKKYWWLIQSSQVQAEKLLALNLDVETQEMVEAYVTLLEKDVFTRYKLLQKYRFDKNRLLHTLIFKSLILTKLGYRRT